MKNDLLARLQNNTGEQDKTYHAFKKSIDKNPLFFAIWLKDNTRLYYSYNSLNHYTLSANAKRLLLVIAGEQFVFEGEYLEAIAKQPQNKKIEYLRELPEGEKPPQDKKTIISRISLIET